MVCRLDPGLVLIDCEEHREEMSASTKTNNFYPEVRFLDRQLVFLTPALISNSQPFFFVFNNQI